MVRRELDDARLNIMKAFMMVYSKAFKKAEVLNKFDCSSRTVDWVLFKAASEKKYTSHLAKGVQCGGQAPDSFHLRGLQSQKIFWPSAVLAYPSMMIQIQIQISFPTNPSQKNVPVVITTTPDPDEDKSDKADRLMQEQLSSSSLFLSGHTTS